MMNETWNPSAFKPIVGIIYWAITIITHMLVICVPILMVYVIKLFVEEIKVEGGK